MKIKNIAEDMVWQELDTVLKAKPGACDCSKCRADIAAYALNHIQPRYVVSNTGATITRAEFLDRDLHTVVIVALAEAVEVVTKNPRHDRE
ncbi:late competence development ComFB family protein [Syntrophomonas erecta]